MEKSTADNYEKQVYIARELFLKYDQQKILRRFPLKYSEEYLYISMLDTELRVSRRSGQVDKKSKTEYELCIDYATVMTIYDLLCYSEELPVLSGMWCPLNSLQVTLSNPDADLFTRKYARSFSGKIQELKSACRQVGGIEPVLSARPDVCWQFDVFPGFPIQFRFWDGDDEFEPKIQLLWDKNALKFMHFETLYYVVGILMQRLETLVNTKGVNES